MEGERKERESTLISSKGHSDLSDRRADLVEKHELVSGINRATTIEIQNRKVSIYRKRDMEDEKPENG